jgi:hypothetical protein
MGWKIDPKARTAEIEGAGVWRWREPTVGEYKAYAYGLERQATVYAALESARQAFMNGQADYKGAAEQIGHLVDESNAAAMELLGGCREAGRWFDGPMALGAAFEGKLDLHLGFLREWLASFKPSEGTLKNSPRGRSASSPAAPPETAPSAGGSSSTPKEASPAPARQKTKASRRKAV